MLNQKLICVGDWIVIRAVISFYHLRFEELTRKILRRVILNGWPGCKLLKRPIQGDFYQKKNEYWSVLERIILAFLFVRITKAYTTSFLK